MAGITAWILGDQLSLDNPALDGADRVLLVQSTAALRARRFHRQKLHLLLVAMREFADAVAQRGYEVSVLHADSLADGLQAHIGSCAPSAVRLLAPSSRAGRRRLGTLPRVSLLEGSLFLTDPAWFKTWADGRKRLLMEDFYRHQRRRLGVLMDGEEPCGGRWNFDASNRRRVSDEVVIPTPYRPREGEHDEVIRGELDALVAGGLEVWGEDGPRLWPASRAQALRALKHFVAEALPCFGPYQDAMLGGERTLWHSLLSSSLNLGLLAPLECVRAAEDAYRAGDAPLQSVEGFVRQIIGWREYVWSLYWQRDWTGMNGLGATSALPAVLETGETSMACLADAVGGLRQTAYAHHIERLMLFGNLMLLSETAPEAAKDWFHRAFIDGYDWVMAPNVYGMALWADGGVMMTKPYAASGRYVNRMSDHCRGCRYTPGSRVGEDACPFTTLYWAFLQRHRTELARSHRMGPALANLDRIDSGEMAEILARAADLRASFDA